MSDLISKVIFEIKKQQAEIATGAMLRPETQNSFLYAGRWQGLQLAQEIIENAIKEPEDE